MNHELTEFTHFATPFWGILGGLERGITGKSLNVLQCSFKKITNNYPTIRNLT